MNPLTPTEKHLTPPEFDWEGLDAQLKALVNHATAARVAFIERDLELGLQEFTRASQALTKASVRVYPEAGKRKLFT
jgi:hypothetical protein